MMTSVQREGFVDEIPDASRPSSRRYEQILETAVQRNQPYEIVVDTQGKATARVKTLRNAAERLGMIDQFEITTRTLRDDEGQLTGYGIYAEYTGGTQ